MIIGTCLILSSFGFLHQVYDFEKKMITSRAQLKAYLFDILICKMNIKNYCFSHTGYLHEVQSFDL